MFFYSLSQVCRHLFGAFSFFLLLQWMRICYFWGSERFLNTCRGFCVSDTKPKRCWLNTIYLLRFQGPCVHWLTVAQSKLTGALEYKRAIVNVISRSHVSVEMSLTHAKEGFHITLMSWSWRNIRSTVWRQEKQRKTTIRGLFKCRNVT